MGRAGRMLQGRRRFVTLGVGCGIEAKVDNEVPQLGGDTSNLGVVGLVLHKVMATIWPEILSRSTPQALFWSLDGRKTLASNPAPSGREAKLSTTQSSRSQLHSGS
ncbi:hypothetical protein EVAR_27529_1 [Eumeta japonica]|uniref:Uncharacterized protein n=1 Tax=Eumeta variegata TaxID=151549 RepID=A0A4C1W5M2_EUMVA|nr:hypothetical protein EVAR_27529_1 [Eumeta japonica]